MPDHVHFFCRAATATRNTLSGNIQRWKEWTNKRLRKQGLLMQEHLWQPNYFDRLIRKESELEEKRLYMLDNPVRKGLATHPDEWPFRGDLNMYREK